MLREDTYTDNLGRKFRVLIPEQETDLSKGMIIGPPFLDELNLPLSIEVRLHNELFNRKLYTKRDVLKRLGEVEASLKAAFKVDVQSIMSLYKEEG